MSYDPAFNPFRTTTATTTTGDGGGGHGELHDLDLAGSLPASARRDEEEFYSAHSGASALGSDPTSAVGGVLGSTPAPPLGASASASGTSTTTTQSQSLGGQNTLTSRLCGFLSVEYYQPYFEVSTAQVTARVKAGANPMQPDVFATSSEANPDLYGPFWIATTLVFVIGMTSMLNSYLAHSADAERPWERDYTSLTLAATVVYGYAILAPVAVWGAALYSGAAPTASTLRLWGMYGYSLVLFVPTALLCTIPSPAVQWLAVIAATAVSCVVLFRNLSFHFAQTGAANAQASSYSAVPSSVAGLAGDDGAASSSSSGGGLAGLGPTVWDGGAGSNKRARTIVLGALALHAVFAVMLKLFFFQGADLSGVLPHAATAAPGGVTASPVPAPAPPAPGTMNMVSGVTVAPASSSSVGDSSKKDMKESESEEEEEAEGEAEGEEEAAAGTGAAGGAAATGENKKKNKGKQKNKKKDKEGGSGN